MFLEPVVTPSGRIYEREAILEYLLNKTKQSKQLQKEYEKQQVKKIINNIIKLVYKYIYICTCINSSMKLEILLAEENAKLESLQKK
jgi:hypothetical protein